jgi:hypothetical protein
MLRKILALSFVALLASASLAEAGLFGGCGGAAAGRRGMFGRRAAYAAAPCGQAGFSASASYYSATSYGAACYSTPVSSYQFQYQATSVAPYLPAPATYVAPAVTASPQSVSLEGWKAPSKTLPIPSDHRSNAPWLKNDNGAVPPPKVPPTPPNATPADIPTPAPSPF